MGKNQRHKKVLRSEKAKVKLKAKMVKTKFLPKGQNVTDVNFKIKPIVIPEQLKTNDSTDEPLTTRKLSFKDLLTRLNHHNLSAKCEACAGLSELVNNSPPALIEQHLPKLLQGVCKLTLDIEGKAREKAIKLLSEIMKNVSTSDKLSPFFDILISYATCAMTHIKRNVQEDALLVIDTYLQYAPLLVYRYFDKLLDGFLSLISRLRTDSKLSHTLTDNLNSKLTSIKWRIKVLKRLQLIIQVYIDENNKYDVKEISNCITLHSSQVGHFIPLYKGIQDYSLDICNYRGTKDGVNKNKMEYVGILIPLLYETWAEVAPLNDINSMEDGVTILQQDAASVLSRITSIYYLLWKLVKLQKDVTNKEIIKVFLSKNHQKFLNHLLNQFPFRQNENRRQGPTKDMKLLEINMDPKCINENLLIALMFCVLHRTFATQFSVGKAQEIIDYLETCLVNRNYVSTKNIETLTMVLQVVLFENSRNWMQRNINVLRLLDNVIRFYKNLPTENKGKVQVFNLLCDVVQIEHLRSEMYEKWLCTLPSLLCKPTISARMVNILSTLTREINKTFLFSFKTKLPDVLANLTTIDIIDKDDNDLYPYHLKIVSMFQYLPLDEEDKKLLLSFIKNHNGSKMADHLSNILQYQI